MGKASQQVTATFHYVVLTKFHMNWSSFPNSKTTPFQGLVVTLTILRHFGDVGGREVGQEEKV